LLCVFTRVIGFLVIWQGEGLVLNILKHSESNIIITLFTPDKGIMKMLVRGGQSKKRAAIFQDGNVISCVWKARLEEHLGSVSSEAIVENFAAKFLFVKNKLLALKTILELLTMATKAGEDYPVLYQITIEFLSKVRDSDLEIEDYINYELAFLSQIGYGLNLKKCSVTGSSENLYYVSPKTGCVVTKDVGQKYHDKLIILPDFMQGRKKGDIDVARSFNLTGYFLEKYLLIPNGLKMPYSRNQLQLSFG